MADSQATETVSNGHADAPTDPTTETIPAPRRSLLETLPQALADDSYVRYLAAECDRARDQRDAEYERGKQRLDEERAAHRETRNDLYDSLQRSIEQAGRLDAANARADRYQAAWKLAPYIMLSIVIVAIAAMSIVGSIWGA